MTAIKTGAVLAVVRLAHLQAGDLGDGVGLVGRLQRPGQQVFLAQRLRRQLRIDAGGAEKEQTFDAVPPCLVDHVVLDHQVVVDELRRISVVGVNPPNLRRRRNTYSGRSQAKKAATAA